MSDPAPRLTGLAALLQQLTASQAKGEPLTLPAILKQLLAPPGPEAGAGASNLASATRGAFGPRPGPADRRELAGGSRGTAAFLVLQGLVTIGLAYGLQVFSATPFAMHADRTAVTLTRPNLTGAETFTVPLRLAVVGERAEEIGGKRRQMRIYQTLGGIDLDPLGVATGDRELTAYLDQLAAYRRAPAGPPPPDLALHPLAPMQFAAWMLAALGALSLAQGLRRLGEAPA